MPEFNFDPTEEQAASDYAAEAAHMEQEEQQARAEGYCLHCGDTIKNCTGYKCWI
jgi:hypothetical protein